MFEEQFDGYEDAVDEMRAEQEQDAREALESCLDEAEEAEDDCEDDGQPDEYTEWQDLPWGGDDDPIYSEIGFFDD